MPRPNTIFGVAPKFLAELAWRPVLLVGLAGFSLIGTVLPAQAAVTSYFTPIVATNPACLDANHVTAKPNNPGYPQVFGNALFISTFDDNGNGTESTYVNENQWCVRADWKFDAAASSRTCQYWLSVANDVKLFDAKRIGANATFVVGFDGSDGNTLVATSDPLYEAHDAGYTLLPISNTPRPSVGWCREPVLHRPVGELETRAKA
jgi:hypothetical protein